MKICWARPAIHVNRSPRRRAIHSTQLYVHRIGKPSFCKSDHFDVVAKARVCFFFQFILFIRPSLQRIANGKSILTMLSADDVQIRCVSAPSTSLSCSAIRLPIVLCFFSRRLKDGYKIIWLKMLHAIVSPLTIIHPSKYRAFARLMWTTKRILANRKI